MRTKTIRSTWLIACMVALLLTAGCFQSDGADTLQATPFGQAGPTFTLPPSNTPEPLPTYTFYPTTDANLFDSAAVDDGVDDAGIQDTFSDTSTVTQDPLALLQNPTSESPIILDADQIRATEIIAGATATIDAQNTATAQALFGFPTATTAIDIGTGGLATATQGIINTAPGVDCVHEVRAGENLFRIALTYGLTIQDVAASSGIVNPTLILVGQRLTIPGCGNTGARPLPSSTPGATTAAIDTSASTGSTTTTTTGGGVTIPASEITSGAYFPNGTPVGGVLGSTTTTTTTTGGTVHTVQQGETLYEISLQYGVTVADLAAANGLTDINTIFINQQLAIP